MILCGFLKTPGSVERLAVGWSHGMPDRSSPRELSRGCGQERRFLVASLSGFEGHLLGAM